MWEIEKAILLTNNDRVVEKFGDKIHCIMCKNYEEVMIKTRDMVYAGNKLLTHPQASSLKPNQTLYRSIIIYPKEGEDKNVAKKSDEQIKELFLSVKGTEEQWKEMISIKDDLMDMVRKSTAEAFNSKELVDKTVNGRLSVPLVIIGKSEKAIDFTEATDAESHFIDSVDKYLEKIKKDSEKKDESTPSSSDEKKDETKTESTKTDKSSS